MIRLSKNKTPQRNTYSESNSKKTPSRVNTRIQSVQEAETKSQRSELNIISFRKSMLWFCSTLFVTGLMLIVGYGFYSLTNYVLTHPYFTIKNIEVVGNLHLSEEEVILISDIDEGMNSLNLQLDEIQGRMLQNPWIEDTQIIRDLPNDITIKITERTPYFWYLHNNELFYLDDKGRLITRVESKGFTSLPLLYLAQGAESALKLLPIFLQEVRENKNILPFDVKEVAWFRLSAGKGIEMFWENNQMIISLAAEDWLKNLDNLSVALRDLIKKDELDSVAEIHSGNEQVWLIRK